MTRKGIRRSTRLTNAFSKKVENVAHAVGLLYTYYNSARSTSRSPFTNEDGSRPQRAPAIAVGVTEHVWTLTEIAGP